MNNRHSSCGWTTWLQNLEFLYTYNCQNLDTKLNKYNFNNILASWTRLQALRNLRTMNWTAVQNNFILLFYFLLVETESLFQKEDWPEHFGSSGSVPISNQFFEQLKQSCKDLRASLININLLFVIESWNFKVSNCVKWAPSFVHNKDVIRKLLCVLSFQGMQKKMNFSRILYMW